jgi:FKBP-type peptidyl-prolyl cis-trans isomerase FklB
MKKILAAILGILILAGGAEALDKTALKKQKTRVSYSIGVDIGRNMKKSDVDVDPVALAQGIKDAMYGSPLLTDKEMKTTLDTYKKELQARKAELAKKKAESNRKEGEAFLEANKKKPGVKTLPSGLQYRILKAGSGKAPKAGDTVVVNYRGTHLNGVEFDSSLRYGGSQTMKVSAVIAGWKEALQMMPVGSKWMLYIPSNLAYGERGAVRDIGPNETLIFEVELLAVR